MFYRAVDAESPKIIDFSRSISLIAIPGNHETPIPKIVMLDPAANVVPLTSARTLVIGFVSEFW